MKHRSVIGIAASLALAFLLVIAATDGQAAPTDVCERFVTADVVAFDKPLVYNRLGTSNVNGMMFALKRDVINVNSNLTLTGGGVPTPGQLDLRGDKRHRPLVLRVRIGDCLTVNLENLLDPLANPLNLPKVTAAGNQVDVFVDEQVADRTVGFHVSGMQLVNSINDDSSMVGNNHLAPGADAVYGSLVPQGGTRSYTLYAEKEGVFLVKSDGATFGSDANQGHSSLGLFGQVVVEPRGSAIYRSQVFEEEMRLAADINFNGVLDGGEKTPDGHPIINYEAVYPATNPDATASVWAAEGKAGLPILNMMKCTDATHCEIVHSEINAVVAYGPSGATTLDGMFPTSTYPLESAGKRNPLLPNRLEPFREFASVWHDEPAAAQAFPGFFVTSPVFKYVLAGVKDGFMINYGSGGIGSEIIANRLRVGPMHDCLTCAYEEFFLTSYTVGDPAMTVNVPANAGLETLLPGVAPAATAQGPKATYAIGAEDPANIHHSYTGDFAKFRNTHIGKEQHVFHLHNHQWLYNPNDDNSNYLDAQGIGPGIGYTYEINNGGSGNRNKSAGDAIFHCHFYPHFAQGMWYHWRHNDTMQTGTILAASGVTFVGGDVFAPQGYHTTPWALKDTTPAFHPKAGIEGSGVPAFARVKAYPDGEIVAGTPIPAVVPLPGKPMAPMGGDVAVVPNVNTTTASLFHATQPGAVVPVGSNALVVDRTKNPGFPFWVAGIEHIVGQRPPTPPLDMLRSTATLPTVNVPQYGIDNLYKTVNLAQADGWDGGLPRHSLEGSAAGGEATSIESAIDFSKEVHKAKPMYYPEEGTDVEQVAMAFHARLHHDTFLPNGDPATLTAGFRTNGGGGPVVGAPFHNPCIDDKGDVLHAGVTGNFFSGDPTVDGYPFAVTGRSVFNSDTPRIYKGTFMQFDAVLNKVGYHYPQQRIVALWQDVGPVINKAKAPEPLVMRFDTFDCAIYHNSNLVPEVYVMDDYQVRTPTDIISQHIHLPKWDLTTTDGAANGWNYEDGTLSPGAVRERIHAIRTFNACATADPRNGTVDCPEALPHPYFASVATALDGAPLGTLPADNTFAQAWLGARTTMQRWFFDPVVNVAGVDRGLGIIFTHDHYGPSTHQQIGLYSTALTEPAGSTWKHNETGLALGCDTAVNPTMPAASLLESTAPCRWDGGPTSWQAQIHPKKTGQLANVKAETLEQYREFYFEYTDFQHAYEAGVYVGANQKGLPLRGAGTINPATGTHAPVVGNEGNALFTGNAADAFRFAINPPARFQNTSVFPDLVVEAVNCVVDPLLGVALLTRPCPQAIDVQDPGILVVNYRHEPVGLRVYDPLKIGPDGKPGMQADGERGDLAFALQSRTDRAIAQLNVQPAAGANINGTIFPPPINRGGVGPGDPFTPMVRAYTGDVIRVKMQAGGDEEEHNATITGLKWLQAGSGHGRAPNSGWRNAQAGGISEQFTLTAPVVPSVARGVAFTDYSYSMDAGNDGWWSGMWGILRSYNRRQGNLNALPDNPPSNNQATIANANIFGNRGVCPTAAPPRVYNVTAVLANQVLPNTLGVHIPAKGGDFVADNSVGGSLNPNGGTLVYNHRFDVVKGSIVPEGGTVPVTVANQGPIHDPTAILYVRTEDLVNPANPLLGLKPGAPVEPLVLRAAAGDCIQVNLTNRLPALQPVLVNGVTRFNSTAPDLATYSVVQGVVKRDRFLPEGTTTFNSNLIRPSSWVSLTPQLVAVDQAQHAGRIVGTNSANDAVKPGGTKTYFWYAGDMSAKKTGNATYTLFPVPVELGGSNLLPADTVKQGAKSLVGALVVEPAGSSWTDNTPVFDHQTGGGILRASRAQVTVCPGSATCADGQSGSFRDFSLVLTKGLTQYYSDNATKLILPVEHMNGEGVGIPEDSQEASGMALNYGVEPMWFRFGILPQSVFGGAGCGTAASNECYGDIPNAHQAFSNVLTGGADPATPVFQVRAGDPARIRITNPFGTTRGSTFALHGHVWQRDPYVCGDNQYGMDGKCNAPEHGSLYDPWPTTAASVPLVGSRAIGTNPQGFAEGGRESWNAPSHFDIVLPGAGGVNKVPGDYLFRDQASFGSTSGVWGILRVNPVTP
ncbi:MAG TPA: hypothetical protein VF853_03140 [Candidatus Deferrimicrobiaceae bacterium]